MASASSPARSWPCTAVQTRLQAVASDGVAWDAPGRGWALQARKGLPDRKAQLRVQRQGTVMVRRLYETDPRHPTLRGPLHHRLHELAADRGVLEIRGNGDRADPCDR